MKTGKECFVTAFPSLEELSWLVLYDVLQYLFYAGYIAMTGQLRAEATMIAVPKDKQKES